MENWKQKIDEKIRKLNAEEAARKARIEEEGQRVEAKTQADEEEAYALNLREHQIRFKCHIVNCNHTSPKPGLEEYEYQSTRRWDGDDGKRTGTRESWNVPTDIFFCSNCKKPTCSEHIYMGICMICADKI